LGHLYFGLSHAPVEGLIEAFDQDLSVYRLVQETYCSRLQRSRANCVIMEGCDENDRSAAAPGKQAALQLDTAHARHLNVGDYARHIVQARRLQKILGRRKHAGDESKRPHEILHCVPNGRIILDDRDHWYVQHAGRVLCLMDRAS
jgi:hypothetical protein